MKTISCFFKRHKNAKAWLFGKGPGLDSFDMAQAGELRICINESVMVVPEPTYFFAHDEGPIKQASKCWPRLCIAILQNIRASYALRCGIPQNQIYIYDLRHRDTQALTLSAKKIEAQSVTCVQ